METGPGFGSRFLLRLSVAQRERIRGRRIRREKMPMMIDPMPIIASAGRSVAVLGAIIPSAAA